MAMPQTPFDDSRLTRENFNKMMEVDSYMIYLTYPLFTFYKKQDKLNLQFYLKQS